MHSINHLLTTLLCLCPMLVTTKLHAQDTALVAFTIEDSTLIPEGIAHYQETNTFFISSIHRKKIIAVDGETGSVHDFIRSEQNGFQGGVGLKVSQKNHLLYALCYSKIDSQYLTGMYIYDLKTRALILRIKEEGPEKKLFNDLVLDRKGNVYISDTERSCIWLLQNGSRKLELFYQEEDLFPNGIAIDKDRNRLFIASWEKGILKLDKSSDEAVSIHAGEVPSMAIDGLYYFKNTLLAIHNGTVDRIVQYALDKDGMSEGWKIIDEENPYFDLPTTGVVVDDHFYCIANSQITKLNQASNSLLKKSTLDPTYILRYELDTGKRKKKRK